MAARRFLLAAAVSMAVSRLFAPASAHAGTAPTQDVDSAKNNFIGEINANNVFVRSAARDDAYPSLKLDKGAKVTVVGLKYKWLKILPPEGSFAYVPKAYISMHGNGKVGRADREVLAKVGSSLNPMKTAPMAKIEDKQEVEILGEQDEYYKIKPTPGSVLYVNESFVDPVKALPQTPESKSNGIAATPPQEHVSIARLPAALKPKAATTKPSAGQDTLTSETPQADENGDPVARAAATQPTEAVADATETYEKLEAQFKEANSKSITEQPIDSLLAGYQQLLKTDALDRTMRKVVEVRVATLKLRSEAKGEFVAVQEARKKAEERERTLAAENDEIKQQIKDHDVVIYTAVGTLRASSLQRGTVTLYRLTDPATGRTVAYLRTNDAKYATFLGQFIGIKGTVTTDSALNMKVIESPGDPKAVDPSKVNGAVTAQIVPPSMVGNVRSASTAGE